LILLRSSFLIGRRPSRVSVTELIIGVFQVGQAEGGAPDGQAAAGGQGPQEPPQNQTPQPPTRQGNRVFTEFFSPIF